MLKNIPLSVNILSSQNKMHRKPYKRAGNFLNGWLAVACASLLFASNVYVDEHGVKIIALAMGELVWLSAWTDAIETNPRARLAAVFVLAVSALTNISLWATCRFADLAVCDPATVRSMYFANFAYPQILVIANWLGARLIARIRKE